MEQLIAEHFCMINKEPCAKSPVVNLIISPLVDNLSVSTQLPLSLQCHLFNSMSFRYYSSSQCSSSEVAPIISASAKASLLARDPEKLLTMNTLSLRRIINNDIRIARFCSVVACSITVRDQAKQLANNATSFSTRFVSDDDDDKMKQIIFPTGTALARFIGLDEDIVKDMCCKEGYIH